MKFGSYVKNGIRFASKRMALKSGRRIMKQYGEVFKKLAEIEAKEKVQKP